MSTRMRSPDRKETTPSSNRRIPVKASSPNSTSEPVRNATLPSESPRSTTTEQQAKGSSSLVKTSPRPLTSKKEYDWVSNLRGGPAPLSEASSARRRTLNSDPAKSSSISAENLAGKSSSPRLSDQSPPSNPKRQSPVTQKSSPRTVTSNKGYDWASNLRSDPPRQSPPTTSGKKATTTTSAAKLMTCSSIAANGDTQQAVLDAAESRAATSPSEGLSEIDNESAQQALLKQDSEDSSELRSVDDIMFVASIEHAHQTATRVLALLSQDKDDFDKQLRAGELLGNNGRVQATSMDEGFYDNTNDIKRPMNDEEANQKTENSEKGDLHDLLRRALKQIDELRAKQTDHEIIIHRLRQEDAGSQAEISHLKSQLALAFEQIEWERAQQSHRTMQNSSEVIELKANLAAALESKSRVELQLAQANERIKRCTSDSSPDYALKDQESTFNNLLWSLHYSALISTVPTVVITYAGQKGLLRKNNLIVLQRDSIRIFEPEDRSWQCMLARNDPGFRVSPVTNAGKSSRISMKTESVTLSIFYSVNDQQDLCLPLAIWHWCAIKEPTVCFSRAGGASVETSGEALTSESLSSLLSV